MGMNSHPDSDPARQSRHRRFRRSVAGWARLDNTHRWWMRCVPVVGLASLIWFLIRVVPKPSRATYPCQRVAFPLASGFVVWVLAGLGSIVAWRKARGHLRRSHRVAGLLLLVASAGLVYMGASQTAETPLIAAPSHLGNQPIGVGQGIHPGRVVWVHHPDVTHWDGPGSGGGHWWDNEATDQRAVERMMSGALRGLAGTAGDADAWDALFRHFNESKGRGDRGYQPGEKVMVKLNLVATHYGLGNVDADGNQVETEVFGLDVAGVAPQLALALVRQLVYEAGVSQADITIGDTLCRFPNRYWDPIHAEFPGVACIDHEGAMGRAKPYKSDAEYIYWSAGTTEPRSEGVPTCFAEAAYVINVACLKGHALAGVTLCAKNHYGSLCRTPVAWDANWDPDYLDLHASLAQAEPGMGNYRALVDLLGSQHLGGKTMLYLIDGLYGAAEALGPPSRWNVAPFNGDWTSSLFVSQDPVAIDSVGYDFLLAEFTDGNPRLSGADDYLHEAAQADAPSSGTFYDPDHLGNIQRLASLGVHEHWSDPVDKLYSRNLGTGDGIELVASTTAQADINSDGKVGFEDVQVMAEQWLDVPAVPSADLAPAFAADGVVDFRDFAVLAEYWRTPPDSVAR